jgi:hypothetical protein
MSDYYTYKYLVIIYKKIIVKKLDIITKHFIFLPTDKKKNCFEFFFKRKTFEHFLVDFGF